MTDSFPKLVEWAKVTLPADRLRAFEEYWYAVDYHLRVAEEACSEAHDYLRDVKWALAGPRAVVVYPWSFERLVQSGDSTVREAASVLDTALQLMAFLSGRLEKGLIKKNVHWGRGSDRGELRDHLSSLKSAEAGDLVEVVDLIFGSIGYELLKGYRDWVTHRGAPHLVARHDEQVPVELPEDVSDAPDAEILGFRVRGHLTSILGDLLEVHCYPFVPPVATSIESLKIESPEGQKIVSIKQARFVIGNLSEEAKTFRHNNPIVLDEQQVMLAGEPLAAYRAPDYLHGLTAVRMFVRRAVSREWDEALTAFCSAGVLP